MDYQTNNYRHALKQIVEERRLLGHKTTFTALAGAARIQKAYLSKVLRGDAELNADQLFQIVRYLQLSRDDEIFLGLLLEISRSSLRDRQVELRKELEAFRRAREQTLQRLKGQVEVASESYAEYFCDPYVQIVHVALNIERFQKSPSDLAQNLGLSRKRLEEIIEKLRALNLVEDSGSKLVALKSWMHLPAESPLTAANRNLARLASQNRLQRQMNDEDYSITVSFSAEMKSLGKIREKILELVGGIEGVVRQSKDEEVFQLNLDLFSWTR